MADDQQCPCGSAYNFSCKCSRAEIEAFAESKKKKKYPPLENGTRVGTVQVRTIRGFTIKGNAKKRFGRSGLVADYSDSHGLCYEVVHKDGSRAWYDPLELEVINDDKPWPKKIVARIGSWLK